MKVYMDCCCYNRPFDDQTQDRVFLEAEAIISILKRCQSDDYKLYTSDALEFEILNISNMEKRCKVAELSKIANCKLADNEQSAIIANELQKNGIKWLDSVHLSVAIANNVDVFLTTDDKLILRANNLGLKIKVINPLKWVTEVLDYE